MRPICYVGSCLKAKEIMERDLDDFEHLVLQGNIDMDAIKDFRSFLLHNALKKRIGVIYFFNKLTDAQQAVLLKIFEELPDYSIVRIHAFGDISFTIQTRCEMHYLDPELGSEAKWAMDFIMECMKDGKLQRKHMEGFYVYMEALSMFNNSLLSNDELNIIMADLK